MGVQRAGGPPAPPRPLHAGGTVIAHAKRFQEAKFTGKIPSLAAEDGLHLGEGEGRRILAAEDIQGAFGEGDG